MMSWIREKFGTVVISGIIGFITVVFVFYGFFSPSATRGLHEGAVAGKVNGDSISIQDFNRELNRKVEFFKQMAGGSLSEEQMKAFHLREGVFDELARRKLMVQEADRRGIVASDEQIRSVIQEMPYFQKDGKFDLLTYKQVLENNHYNPSGFERLMREDLSSAQWEDFFKRRTLVTPEEARKEFLVENDKRSVKYVLLNNETGRRGITVPAEEVKKYLADPAKLNTAKAQFEGRKEMSYKGKTFDDVKEDIARELLAGQKVDEIQKINEKLAEQVRGVLAADKASDAKVNALLKPYGAEVKTSPLFSRQYPQIPGIGENRELATDSFLSKSPIDPNQGGKAKKYTGAGSLIIALLQDKQIADVTKFDGEREKLVRQIAGKKQQAMFQNWVGELRKKAKIDMNPAIVGGGGDSEG